MAGFQYAHVEVYSQAKTSRKKSDWTAFEIVAEAERSPGSCDHVTNPKDPELLYGTLPSEALKAVIQILQLQRDPRGRRIRKDTPCLVAGVASYPMPANADNQNEIRRWVMDCIRHLKVEFGPCLKSVLLHMDEQFPHLHFFATAPDGRAKSIHPGHRLAKNAGKGVFKKAMSSWLDRWHEVVSRRHGMARTGPKRERLTREEWKARQQSAELLAKADKIIDTAASIELDLEARKLDIAGQLRTLNMEKRNLDRRAGDLTAQEIERKNQINEEREALKNERLELKARKARLDIDAEKIRTAGTQLSDFQKRPGSEQFRLAQEAEGKTADAEKKLKKAQERERSLEAALNKEINLVKAMEALLTPQQKAQIKLSRQATS
jgi:hypothetical protein